MDPPPLWKFSYPVNVFLVRGCCNEPLACEGAELVSDVGMVFFSDNCESRKALASLESTATSFSTLREGIGKGSIKARAMFG